MSTVPSKETIALRYIGKKSRYIDRMYGTGGEWLPGEIIVVPAEVGAKMRVHTDVYEVVEAKVEDWAEVVATVTEIDEPVIEAEEQPQMPSVMPNLANMGKDELVSYAQRHLSEKLPKTMKEDTMRDKIINLIQSGRFLE